MGSIDSCCASTLYGNIQVKAQAGPIALGNNSPIPRFPAFGWNRIFLPTNIFVAQKVPDISWEYNYLSVISSDCIYISYLFWPYSLFLKDVQKSSYSRLRCCSSSIRRSYLHFLSHCSFCGRVQGKLGCLSLASLSVQVLRHFKG